MNSRGRIVSTDMANWMLQGWWESLDRLRGFRYFIMAIEISGRYEHGEYVIRVRFT
jgi:hypothetical protein